MTKNITIISSGRGSFIELIHRDSDPGVWIVRRWRKFLWFRKRVSSDWFTDRQQAMAFANEHSKSKTDITIPRDTKEILLNAE